MKACFQIFGDILVFVGWLAPAYGKDASQFQMDTMDSGDSKNTNFSRVLREHYKYAHTLAVRVKVFKKVVSILSPVQ